MGGRPPFTPLDARRIVRELYGIDGRASELVAEFDRNFLVEDGEGRRFVLKISPVGTNQIDVDCQIQVVRFLAETPLAPWFQKVVSATDGTHLVSVEAASGDRHWARLLTYLEGHKLVHLPEHPDALLRGLGNALARLDQSLEAFDHPGAHREIPWDIGRVLELESLLEHVVGRARRELVRGMMDRLRNRLLPRFAGLPHSVIYNDANDHNILVSDLDPRRARLCGFIDFGDMVYTATVCELAIACAYVMLDKRDPMAAATRVVEGYDEQRPLEPLERSLLYDLVLARLCASALMSAGAGVNEPDNVYRMVSSEPVWRLLEKLSAIGVEQYTW